MSVKKCLPHFLVIGAMKCGTTSLHNYLKMHQDIFASDVKEINFFNQNYGKGIEWYKSHFSYSDEKIGGESSQSYSRAHLYPNICIPKRIYDLIPDVKLIYLVRDPVERIISHYYETISLGYRPPKNFVEHIIEYPDNNWVNTSKYFWQLEEYLNLFNDSQFLIITTEELQSHRLSTLNRIFSFLGVDVMKEESCFDFQKNTRQDKVKNISLPQNNFIKAIAKVIPQSLKNQIKGLGAYRKMTTRNIQEIHFLDNEKSKLRELLYQDFVKLKSITDASFDSWGFNK